MNTLKIKQKSGATTTINIFESILSQNKLKMEKTNG